MKSMLSPKDLLQCIFCTCAILYQYDIGTRRDIVWNMCAKISFCFVKSSLDIPHHCSFCLILSTTCFCFFCLFFFYKSLNSIKSVRVNEILVQNCADALIVLSALCKGCVAISIAIDILKLNMAVVEDEREQCIHLNFHVSFDNRDNKFLSQKRNRVYE